MNLSYFKKVTESELVIFNLEGKILTSDDTEDITNEINECIENNQLHLIFDLEQLDYINSTGLNFIISSFTRVRNAGGELVISSVSEKVEDLLVITKLNTILTSFETLEEAKESFGKKTIINH